MIVYVPSLGSSPLTRGKPEPRTPLAGAGGLIPAHAGKTPRREAAALSRSAHPRSRGENLAWAVDGAREYGSSPLTRGKHLGLALQHPEDGLIPAHAGKTASSVTALRYSTAHPRSRGENSARGPQGVGGPGSSPLTRGKRRRDGCRGPALRLIPAHAGKTRSTWSSMTGKRAHPRSRGENKRSDHWDPGPNGSSPLTRGKRRRLQVAGLVPGLIPAHAGKT